MLQAKRLQEIIKIVEHKGQAKIKELAGHFNVSNMTILRDIKLLKQNGLVTSVRGGILPADASNVYLNSKEFNNTFVQHAAATESQIIAQWCAENLVKNNMVIALGNGLLIKEMVKFLTLQKNLKILTNALSLAKEALDFIDESSDVILSGGKLEKSSYTSVGSIAESFFVDNEIDIAFITGVAFDLDLGLMDSNPTEIKIKKAIIKNAKKKVLLLDGNKFDRRSMLASIALSDIDMIVTTKNISNNAKDALENLKIELKLV